MPIACLSLRRGKPPHYLQALAESVYQAMHEAYDVAVNGRFVWIHNRASYEMSVDRDHMGSPRSLNFVLVEQLAESPGIDPEDVMGNIATTALEDWSFGGGRAGITSQGQS